MVSTKSDELREAEITAMIEEEDRKFAFLEPVAEQLAKLTRDEVGEP